MAKIIIVNGTAQETLPAGTYSGSTTATGYATETITDLVISASQNLVELTIGATGSLTITLTDSVSGDPIKGAKFKRSNADGTTTYGNESTETDDNGQTTFQNLPWAASGAPAVYFMQTATDIYHTLPTTPITTTLTTESGNTLTATNVHNDERTVSLTDKNYLGMPIDSAEINIDTP